MAWDDDIWRSMIFQNDNGAEAMVVGQFDIDAGAPLSASRKELDKKKREIRPDCAEFSA